MSGLQRCNMRSFIWFERQGCTKSTRVFKPYKACWHRWTVTVTFHCQSYFLLFPFVWFPLHIITNRDFFLFIHPQLSLFLSRVCPHWWPTSKGCRTLRDHRAQSCENLNIKTQHMHNAYSTSTHTVCQHSYHAENGFNAAFKSIAINQRLRMNQRGLTITHTCIYTGLNEH